MIADNSQKSFPEDLLQGCKVALLTAGFRAGSESMLQSWSAPFAAQFSHHQDVRWLDLALIDSVVCCLMLPVLHGRGCRRD